MGLKIWTVASKMRVFIMRVDFLSLDTFYPILIQLQKIDQIGSLFYLFLIFQVFPFTKIDNLLIIFNFIIAQLVDKYYIVAYVNF